MNRKPGRDRIERLQAGADSCSCALAATWRLGVWQLYLRLRAWCCSFAVAPAYVQISPPTSVAAGRISTASPSDRASEIIPTSAGDGTSPSVWIVKMLRATAVARIAGDTTLTIVELIGPVEMNISTWAVTSAAQKRPGRVATSASRNSGAASRVASPETQR